MMHRARRSHGIRRKPSPFSMRHVGLLQSNSVAAASVFGVNPVVTDTVILAVAQLANISGGATGAAWENKDITIGGIRWSTDWAVAAVVAAVDAYAVVSECLYVADLTPGGVPVLAGQCFLQTNELSSALTQAGQPRGYGYPERILWRRQQFLQIGANVVGNNGRNATSQELLTVKTRARLGPRQGLMWHAELTNSTAGAVTFSSLLTGALALKVDLD